MSYTPNVAYLAHYVGGAVEWNHRLLNILPHCLEQQLKKVTICGLTPDFSQTTLKHVDLLILACQKFYLMAIFMLSKNYLFATFQGKYKNLGNRATLYGAYKSFQGEFEILTLAAS